MAPLGLLAKFRQLSLNQRLTLVLTATSVLGSLASVGVAIAALVVSADNQDIQRAISNLSTLATETKRQADLTGEQLAAVREQVREAKTQTGEIAQQTDAIKDSSEAGAHAAQAQQQLAELTARAQTPRLALGTFGIEGILRQPDKNGRVKLEYNWSFSNAGGSTLWIRDVMSAVYVGAVPPRTMPAAILFSDLDEPLTPNPGHNFFPTKALEYYLPASDRDRLIAGQSNLYFFALVGYVDGRGVRTERCFAREILIDPGSDGGNQMVPTTPPTFDCVSR